MNSQNSNSEDIWLAVKVRGLVTVIGLVVFIGGLLGLAFWLLPAIGMDPNRGASFDSEPMFTLTLVISALFAVLLFSYLAAIVAALVALRLFPADSVRKEFLWFLGFPGLRSANSRLFDSLFKK